MEPGKGRDETGKLKAAIALNAFVLPGAGHIMVGRTLCGILLAGAALVLLALALIKYLMTAARMLALAGSAGASVDRTLQALGQSWNADRSYILWCLAGIVIVWLYGIVDLWRMQRKQQRENP